MLLWGPFWHGGRSFPCPASRAHARTRAALSSCSTAARGSAAGLNPASVRHPTGPEPFDRAAAKSKNAGGAVGGRPCTCPKVSVHMWRDTDAPCQQVSSLGTHRFCWFGIIREGTLISQGDLLVKCIHRTLPVHELAAPASSWPQVSAMQNSIWAA